MGLDDVTSNIEEALRDARNRMIAIYIAVLAVLLAIASIGGNNAAKNAMRYHISAANAFAFYQAKAIRHANLQIAVNELDALLKAHPDMDGMDRRGLEQQIRGYRLKMARYQSDRATGEGKRELLSRARTLEMKRDRALLRDPYFDYAQAFFQIAIILASVSIIAGAVMLNGLSVMSAVLALALMLNGFFLWVDLAILG